MEQGVRRMIDNTIEITYIQGKLTENLTIQTKMLQSGMQVPKFINDRQIFFRRRIRKFKKSKFNGSIMSLNKSQVTKLVIDLFWEYDRMSSDGQESLDKLAKVLNIPTEEEQDKLLASMSKEEINNIILNRCAYPSEDSR